MMQPKAAGTRKSMPTPRVPAAADEQSLAAGTASEQLPHNENSIGQQRDSLPSPEGDRLGTDQEGTGRKRVLVLPTVVCANPLCARISQMAPGTIVFEHQLGCGQLEAGRRDAFGELVRQAARPEVGSVLIISHGCEVINPYELEEEIGRLGKPVEVLDILTAGGSVKTLRAGAEMARRMQEALDRGALLQTGTGHA
ncbi:UxaA family hydrolase [Paenibacillus sp. J31TS4]|uniref:UxaA family hydrolase n=1 Tax=Paenibacillus sp. J31TS4 TaxID=2807195 RepID=UPI001BCE83A4|nr:UxaA family hydrolase [Paenibacillus sp. J31TS4]